MPHVFISRARSPLTKGSSHSPDIYTAVPRCTRIIFFMIHSSGPSRSSKGGGWWRVNCTFIAQLPPSFPSSFSHPAPQLSAHQARASPHPDCTLTALRHLWCDLWCAVALCKHTAAPMPTHPGGYAIVSRRPCCSAPVPTTHTRSMFHRRQPRRSPYPAPTHASQRTPPSTRPSPPVRPTAN